MEHLDNQQNKGLEQNKPEETTEQPMQASETTNEDINFKNRIDLTQDDINKLSDELQKIIDTIESKEERWFELSSKMEE